MLPPSNRPRHTTKPPGDDVSVQVCSQQRNVGLNARRPRPLIVSRLQFLGSRVAGVSIALVGGIATAVTMMASAIVLWVMAQPGIAENRAVLQALYWVVQGFGGAGFSVPFGILAAGVTIPAAFMRLIPTWIMVLGIAVAICGELSWLYLMVPAALPLVPLTRFPGFVWIIAIGLTLPASIERSSSTAEARIGKRM
jgi:hypothetical protein